MQFNPNEFSIRPLELENACDLVLLIQELAVEEGKSVDDVAVNPAAINEFAFGTKPCFECEMGWFGNLPIAYALFTIRFSAYQGAPVLFLEDLYLKKDYRNQGLGKRLMFRLDEIDKERGCTFLEWQVFNWDSSAKQFYNSIGSVIREDLQTYRTQTGTFTHTKPEQII